MMMMILKITKNHQPPLATKINQNSSDNNNNNETTVLDTIYQQGTAAATGKRTKHSFGFLFHTFIHDNQRLIKYCIIIDSIFFEGRER